MEENTSAAAEGSAAPSEARANPYADKLSEKFSEGVPEGGEGSARPQSLREFLLRGNIFDLATAVIIGIAFGAVVSSLVNDIIMPPIGLVLGGVDFSSLFVNLSGKAVPSVAAAKAAGAATINYGIFLNTVINFLIIGTVMYLLMRSVTRLTPQVKAPTPQVTTKVCPYCISRIPLNASRCPYCTSQLEESQRQPDGVVISSRTSG